MQYTQDYDETLPTMDAQVRNPPLPSTMLKHYNQPGNSTFRYATSPYQNWIQEIYPYTKSWKAFRCPSARLGQYTPAGLGGYEAEGNSDTSYLLNGVLLQRNLSALSQTSTLIWAQDFINAWNVAVVRPCYYTGTFTALPFPAAVNYVDWVNAQQHSTHFDGRTLLFVDGHAKWRATKTIAATEFGLDSTIVGPSGSSTPAKIDPDLIG